MKKILLGMAALFALTTAVPAFAEDPPATGSTAPAPKKGKVKKGKKAKPAADATK